MLIFCYSFFGAFLVFFAIVTSLEIRSILPALLIVGPYIVIAPLFFIIGYDMKKAYVEIEGDNITFVDYYFFVKKEKHLNHEFFDVFQLLN